MNQEGMFKPALIGGVLLGILSALPFLNLVNCFCCAWVIAGGMLAAQLFVRNSPAIVTLSQGLVLGLMTGAIGAVVETVFSLPLRLMFMRMGPGFAEQMSQAIEQISGLPPETRNTLRSMLGDGSGFGAAFWILGGFLTLVIYAVMGMLGGTIGVALFEKRKPQPPSPEIPPPQIEPPPQYPGT